MDRRDGDSLVDHHLYGQGAVQAPREEGDSLIGSRRHVGWSFLEVLCYFVNTKIAFSAKRFGHRLMVFSFPR